jgi:hypothetical protein
VPAFDAARSGLRAGIAPICPASGGALDDVLRPELLLGTTLMMLAMMGPLTGGPMQHLWHRSSAAFLVEKVVLGCRIKGRAAFMSFQSVQFRCCRRSMTFAFSC